MDKFTDVNNDQLSCMRRIKLCKKYLDDLNKIDKLFELTIRGLNLFNRYIPVSESISILYNYKTRFLFKKKYFEDILEKKGRV